MLPVSLQINTAPVDYAFFPKILKHQLKFFGRMCSEIVITIEERQSERSRWKSSDWKKNFDLIIELCDALKKDYPQLVINIIDYSDEKRKEVSQYFLQQKDRMIPFKDFRGGPYYSYYFGLHSASQPYVFHMDSDILFHGNGEKWLKEATEVLTKDKNVLSVAPIIGPPLKSGQNMPLVHKKRYNPIDEYSVYGRGYQYKDLSTRIFMVEKERLKNFCPITYPHFDQIMKSWLRKTTPYHTPERSISEQMQKENLVRVDFEGTEGLFNLHLTQGIKKSPEFIQGLDVILNKIEEGFFTEDMRGKHDFSQQLLNSIKESF